MVTIAKWRLRPVVWGTQRSESKPDIGHRGRQNRQWHSWQAGFQPGVLERTSLLTHLQMSKSVQGLQKLLPVVSFSEVPQLYPSAPLLLLSLPVVENPEHWELICHRLFPESLCTRVKHHQESNRFSSQCEPRFIPGTTTYASAMEGSYSLKLRPRL